jgi:hypothetical protein
MADLPGPGHGDDAAKLLERQEDEGLRMSLFDIVLQSFVFACAPRAGPAFTPCGNSGGAMPVPVNCDMGESLDQWTMGDGAGLMPLIHIANVAFRFHAGDSDRMRATVRLARKHGVRAGAHPRLPDRQALAGAS